MNKKIEKPSVSTDTLPDYLGLGILAGNSIAIIRDKVYADYIWENEILYHVTVGKSTFQIVEFFGGKQIATTSGNESLQKTFFSHLISQPPYQSKLFERLFHKLADNRNINVRFPRQPRYLYYPAGYIFALRQPIVNNNKSTLIKIEQNLVSSQDSGIKLESKRSGVIMKLLKNGKVLVEQIEVADFGCTLFHLAQSVDILWESGVVPNEKEYRLTVMDSSETPAGNISVYLGDISRGFLTYSVIVTEGAELDMTEVQNTFGNSSIQFLESLKK